MKIISKINDIQSWRERVKNGRSIGFVPTMGALHEAHLSLVNRSKKENDLTVVSIFVNPKQFGPKEDLSKYPRPRTKDMRLLSRNKVQIVFAPTPNSMYPSSYSTTVSVSGIAEKLCGSPLQRGPRHFEGVSTVVTKLFNLVRPTRSYFGMKDFQQVRVIEKMNEDLNLGTKIVRCPTVREKDGLAMSSRNAYLTPQQRAQAPRLYQALQYGRKLLRSKQEKDLKVISQKVKSRLKAIPYSHFNYFELVDPKTLREVRRKKGPLLLAASIQLGKARLIDSILVN